MEGLFMRIVRGEIPAYKVMESEHCLAFLDIFPLVEGHVLVVPKVEVDSVFEVPEPYYTGMWTMARQLAPAIQSAFSCLKVGVAVVGLEVPHAHMHLVPLQSVEDLNFARPKLKMEPSALQAHAERIRSALTLGM
jgi:histidine triad (HIT) family protein